MKNLIIRESEKRSKVCLPKSRLLLAMCLIVIKCVCYAQDVNVVEESSPSAEPAIVQTGSPTVETEWMPFQTEFEFNHNYGVMQLRPVNVREAMRINSPALYSQYNRGRRMQTAGWILTGTGIGSFVLGLGVIGVGAEEDDDEIIGGGAVIMTAGIALMGAGIPILAIGGGKKRRALREFNRQYYSSESPSPYFQINMYPKRVGLAYVF